MKQFINVLILFSLLWTTSINVFGQDQLKAEQAVKNYLTNKYKNYKPLSFEKIFEQYDPTLFEGKLENADKVKYSLIHDYTFGDDKYEHVYFFFDYAGNLLGQLSMKAMMELTVGMLSGKLESIDSVAESDTIRETRKVDYSLNPHLGLWFDGVSYFKFEKNGKCLIINPGDTMGGNSYKIKGEEAKLTYFIDYRTNPINIDIVFTSFKSGQEFARLLGIISFINDTKIKMRINFQDSVRPKDFLQAGNTDTNILIKIK
jgi:hypothetical protein